MGVCRGFLNHLLPFNKPELNQPHLSLASPARPAPKIWH